jgi:hypothetical protein
MPREIKQVWKLPCRPSGVTRVGQPSIRIPQLIEEGLYHCVNGRQSLCRSILEKGGNEVDGVVGGFAKHLDTVSSQVTTGALAAYFTEWMRLDLWKLVLHIVRVHCPNLVPGWSAKNFDDLHQLIDSRFAREKWLSKHQLCHDTPSGPDIFIKS